MDIAQMVQVAHGRTQADAHVPDRLALGELAEGHRNQMRSTVKTFTVPVGPVPFDQFGETTAVELGDYLRK